MCSYCVNGHITSLTLFPFSSYVELLEPYGTETPGTLGQVPVNIYVCDVVRTDLIVSFILEKRFTSFNDYNI